MIQNQIPTDQNVSVVLRCTNAALQQNLPAIGYVVPVRMMTSSIVIVTSS